MGKFVVLDATGRPFTSVDERTAADLLWEGLAVRCASVGKREAIRYTKNPSLLSPAPDSYQERLPNGSRVWCLRPVSAWQIPFFIRPVLDCIVAK